MKVELAQLPPNYSEAHQERLSQLRNMLAEIDAHFRKVAAPIIQEIIAIEACYAPRYVVMPSDITAPAAP
jgi:hypothetical protein